MTLEREIERLKGDYPHLTPEFEGHDKKWACHLYAYTQLFGMYGMESGWGSDKVSALLNARAKIDARSVAAEQAKIEMENSQQEANDRERALDDDMWETAFGENTLLIPPCRGIAA